MNTIDINMPARGGSAWGGKIFCIIPAYNEENMISEVIASVKPLVDCVVVVDDCSKDKTFEISKNAGAVALRHIVNRGQGASLQTGMEYALRNGADIMVHFDADGQFIPSEIKDVVEPIIKGEADVVLGSRFMSKKSDIPWFKKNIIMKLAKLVNRMFLDIDLTDPQSGFRAMSREAGLKVRIEQDRMAHCSELLAKFYSARLRVVEVPTSVIYHDFGQRLGGGVKILKELFIGSLIK